MAGRTLNSRNSNPGIGSLTFPLTKCALWDHTPKASPVNLHVAYFKDVQVELEKRVIQLAYRYAGETQAANYPCILTGSIITDPDGDGLRIIVDRFDPSGDDSGLGGTSPASLIPGDITIPCVITKEKNQSSNDAADYLASMKHLCHNCCSNDKTELTGFLSLRTVCNYRRYDRTVTFTLNIDLVTLGTTFKVTLIKPVPIVPTALSKNLMGPLNLSQVQGEPRMGYMTMDHTRKLLLVLHSDPKVLTLPLIGIWVTGVKYIYDPFVWSSCLRYLHNSSIQERVCQPPEPFLVVLFTPLHSKPEFYECTVDGESAKLSCQLYTATESFQITAGDICDTSTLLEMSPVCSGPKSESFQLAKDELRTNLSERGMTSEKPGSEKTIMEDLLPRSIPAPHQVRSPVLQHHVPEVSLLLDDAGHSQNNSNNVPYTYPELEMDKKHKMDMIISENENISGKKYEQCHSEPRKPLQALNWDFNNVNNSFPRKATPTRNYDMENYDPNVPQPYGLHPRGSVSTSPVYSINQRTVQSSRGMPSSPPTSDPYCVRLPVSQAPPRPNYNRYSGHSAPMRGPYPVRPPWNGQPAPVQQVAYPPRYPPTCPPPVPNPRYHGPCTANCRHPHYQYRPPQQMVMPTRSTSSSSSYRPQQDGLIYQHPSMQRYSLSPSSELPRESEIPAHQPPYQHQVAHQAPVSSGHPSPQSNSVPEPKPVNTSPITKTSTPTTSNDIDSTYKSLPPEDVYEILRKKDRQLEELQAQLKQLLSLQSQPAIQQQETPDISSGSADSMIKATSTSTPVSRKCIATNTSMQWTKSKSKVVDHASQSKLEDDDDDYSSMMSSQDCERFEDSSKMSVNEGLTFSMVQMTALQDPSVESVMSDMIVDIPSYQSSGSVDSSCSLNDSPEVESVSMYDDCQNQEVTPSEKKPESEASPQFYQELIGNIQQLLCANTAGIKPDSGDLSLAESVASQREDVAMATIEQLKKLGVELQNGNNSKDVNRTLLNVEAAVLHKINYVSLMLDDNADTNVSMEVNALAMKYLKDDQLGHLKQTTTKTSSKLLQRVMSKTPGPGVTMCGMTDVSFATHRYMERYGLLDGKDKKQAILASDEESTLHMGKECLQLRVPLPVELEPSMMPDSNVSLCHGMRGDASVSICHGQQSDMDPQFRPDQRGNHVSSTPKSRGQYSICETSRDTSIASGQSSIPRTSANYEPEEESLDQIPAKEEGFRVFDMGCKEMARIPLPKPKKVPISSEQVNDPPAKILDIARLKQLPKLL